MLTLQRAHFWFHAAPERAPPAFTLQQAHHWHLGGEPAPSTLAPHPAAPEASATPSTSAAVREGCCTLAPFADLLDEDTALLVMRAVGARSLADLGAAACTCRRLAALAHEHAAELCAPLAGAIARARLSVEVGRETSADVERRAADAVAEATGDVHFVRAVQRGPCRVADGAWCAHGHCNARPFGSCRPRPGVVALVGSARRQLRAALEDASNSPLSWSASGEQARVRALAAERALIVMWATLLEAVGERSAALVSWLGAAEPPHGCARAQLVLGLHYHGANGGQGGAAGARADARAGARSAAAAISWLSRAALNARAADSEAALAATCVGFIHLDGDGVPVCEPAAREWLSRAARRGGCDASATLRQLDLARGWPPASRASVAGPFG